MMELLQQPYFGHNESFCPKFKIRVLQRSGFDLATAQARSQGHDRQSIFCITIFSPLVLFHDPPMSLLQ
jgi:hypothetical protein